MRVRRMFAAPYMYPSESTRQHPIRAGMEGLRHKSRHKIPRAGAEAVARGDGAWGRELSSREGHGLMESPFFACSGGPVFLYFSGAGVYYFWNCLVSRRKGGIALSRP
jgi:hypothetical protein